MIILATQLALSVRHASPTWNEPDHLLAGYRYWQAADFAINSEHPPLVKFLAAVPLLPLHLRIPQLPQGPSKPEANLAGRKFLFANDADAILFRARLAASLLTFLLAGLLVEATTRMFGRGPTLLALILFVWEPTLLAHGALVTTDMGMTLCLFATVYAFYRYVTRPSRLKLLECGFILGLTFAVKHSGLLAVPILSLLAGAEAWMDHPLASGSASSAFKKKPALRGRHAGQLAAQVLVIVAVGLVVLWASYGFRFRARPENQALTPSLAEVVRDLKSPGEARVLLALERWRLLPEAYLYGLADVLINSAGPRPTFLLGKLYPRGRWFYFPAAFLIKSTLGLLSALTLALLTGTLFRHEVRREILFLALPAAAYFAFSLTSGLNIGVRHILPVYPFLLILAAAGAWTLATKQQAWAYVVAVLVTLHIVSSSHAFPHYLAYSNEAWGGPARTHEALTDSNVDWGQELKTAKHYLDQHRIHDCWLAYFGTADPAYYEIPCKLLPDTYSGWWGKPVDVVPQMVQGTVLISATELAGTYWGPAELNPYQHFLETRPAGDIGGSILVFEGRFDMTAASALSHVSKAWELAASGALDRALAEAHTAVALAPRLAQTQHVLGEMLARTHETQRARQAFQTALSLAETLHPDFQSFWVPYLRGRLARL